jgi:adenylate cyclase
MMQGLRTFFTRWNPAALPGLLALLLILTLQFAGSSLLGGFGMLIFDTYQRLHPRTYETAPVRVVDIDEESLRRYGQWPWPRTQIAELTRKLGNAGAATIAFDIVFSEPDRTSPPQLASAIRRSGGSSELAATLEKLPDNDTEFARALADLPVVNGLFLTHDGLRQQAEPKAGFGWSGSEPNAILSQYSNAILPLPAIAEASSGLGVLTIKGDNDGIIRRAPLLARQGAAVMPALSLEVLRVAQGAGSILVKTSDGSGNMSGGTDVDIDSLKVGQFTVPTNGAGELWMYYTAPRADRVVPAWKVLSGSLPAAEMERLFGGNIIFVGTGAVGLRDLVSTPVQDRELGVIVHAQAAEQMILGRFLTRPDWAIGLERALVVVLGLALLTMLPRLGAAKGAAVGLLFGAVVLGGSWYAFQNEHYLLDPTYPLLAVLTVYLAETAITYYLEERRRRYIHRAFDRYLSPELVNRIAADPRQLELGGEERQMTVLFCDVRSFSRISESLSPKDIIRFLIGFLTPMCDILLERKATIDKFIGDAILAFWNAPLDDADQYRNAARSALAMVTRLEKLNAEMPVKADQPWPRDVKIGIGLNAGPCCVGNMGSAQRLSYSLIGDTVNLASRIEGLTKYYGISIAIGSALQEQIADFATIEVDRVRVVGRDTAETVSALLGDEALAMDPAFLAFAKSHGAMLAAYRAQDWNAARDRLDGACEEAARFGIEAVYILYRERILALTKAPPPPEWDGVFVATEK